MAAASSILEMGVVRVGLGKGTNSGAWMGMGINIVPMSVIQRAQGMPRRKSADAAAALTCTKRLKVTRPSLTLF